MQEWLEFNSSCPANHGQCLASDMINSQQCCRHISGDTMNFGVSFIKGVLNDTRYQLSVRDQLVDDPHMCSLVAHMQHTMDFPGYPIL